MVPPGSADLVPSGNALRRALARARDGKALDAALFTLCDRPEARWRQARQWLDGHGYDDTLSYVRAMAILVLEETGLLPHLNPGVLSWQDFQRLKPLAPSVGMMQETPADRLFSIPGGPHFGSPDKDPKVRLRVLADADLRRPRPGADSRRPGQRWRLHFGPPAGAGPHRRNQPWLTR